MKMVVGLHPNLKLCPRNQLPVNGSQINFPAFSSWKTVIYQTNTSGTLLLLHQLHLFIPCPRSTTRLLYKSAGFTLCFIWWRNVVIRPQVYSENQGSSLCYFLSQGTEAIQGSSALQQIWEVILLMAWLKADLLWVPKVDFQRWFYELSRQNWFYKPEFILSGLNQKENWIYIHILLCCVG